MSVANAILVLSRKERATNAKKTKNDQNRKRFHTPNQPVCIF